MAARAIMSVPKAPVHEYRDAKAGKNDVRRTSQVSGVKPVPISGRKQGRTHRPFRLSVLAAYSGHHLGADFG